MVKISYEYNGKRMNIKQIYSSCKKRRGRSRYLLSVNVKVGQEQKDGRSIDAKIVCVRNRANQKDWLALIHIVMCIDIPVRCNHKAKKYRRPGQSTCRPAEV